jgi:SAM-dependent methyltransferase
MTNEYPESFARFYDVIYHKLRDGIDNEYFLNEILGSEGKVLEVGVGTGRFFIEALNRGADIYGIDISRPMINILLGKLGEDQRKRISRQNIIDFSFDHCFDLIIAPFRVFMHLEEKKDQAAALDNVFAHLKPGGKFIFDAFIPDLNYLIHGFDHHTDFEGEYEPGRSLKRVVTTKPELMKQLINIDFRLEWQDEEGMKREDWQFALRFFFRYELEHLIERSKFREYKIFGDYSGNELKEDSKEFIVVCKK